MGVPIKIHNLGEERVVIDWYVGDIYYISRLRVGILEEVLCTNPNGVYFFDHYEQGERWSPHYSEPVGFVGYDAALIFINLCDPDLLVDKYHSDAIINP
jgi:hypothetical protein